MKSLAPVLAAGLFLSTALSAEPEILLEQSFSSENRSLQQLPSSSAWFGSEPDGVLVNRKGLSSAPNRHLIAYFAETEKPLSLSPGESLTLKISFSVKEPLPKGGVFRVGLFDSQGKRVTEDGQGPNNPLFQNYRGYSAHLDINSPKALSFHRRTEGLSDKLIAGNEAFGEPLLRSTGSGASFDSEKIYTANFKLTRTAQGISLTCDIPELAGYEASVEDTHHPLTTFDTVVLYGARSGMSRFTIERVEIALSK